MNVLIISQCTKRAREETCRIVDHFAERTGHAAWQTTITQEGLSTLRKLLRKSARRNTAVACHWLKKSGQTELLWIVGNQRRFNAQGRVPTNYSTRPLLKADNEHRWQCAESIALLAAIAGLFHDFGKAGQGFQDSLTKKTKRTFQPFRHEWISLRLFQAFVGEDHDDRWLEKLGELTPEQEPELLARLHKDDRQDSSSPFQSLPPLARVIAWLILSHHRLPENLRSNSTELPKNCENWLCNQLNVEWNALNHDVQGWTEKDFKRVWTFPSGTPLQSKTWREKARQIARRVKNTAALKHWGTTDQLFTLHMARFCLMLADHHYSSGAAQEKWQTSEYVVWANSDRKTRALKQRVDEHLCGVAHHALLLGRQIIRARTSLPAISRHKGFRERTSNPRFHWQNKAWDRMVSLREKSQQEGFFGVNMASTGCGKTFANARIMYALSDEQDGCRFTVAMGLRTLTLQTGDALQKRLKLDDDDMAVVIGSRAVKTLWQQSKDLSAQQESDCDSASAEPLDDPHQYVRYEGVKQAGVLQKWLEGDSALVTLVSAPILVSTLDHLISATEGVRGGKQLPAMLRLLTSDLVLDEPDDFDVADLHAVCRLMNWAGMLGTRVLLSSATLPPDLVQALFAAYLAGRKIWHASCESDSKSPNICCAWFDESGVHAEQIADGLAFKQVHKQFVEQRAKMLINQPALHAGRIVPVVSPSAEASDVFKAVATTLHTQIHILHHAHHETGPDGKTVSFGLVRFANINPLVAVGKVLIAMPPETDCCIHYCFYHARHPLAVRSSMEAILDRVLDRHQPEQLWQNPDVMNALSQRSEKHHLFVILGSSVMEVGRDWDASWGIIEPSSMRSIIQFSGRIQRHRRQIPACENIVILNHNIKALRGLRPAFTAPGFETKDLPLPGYDLHDLIPSGDYRTINALPRILPQDGKNALAQLEHMRLQKELLASKSEKPVAANWWRKPLTLYGYKQRRTPFRRSQSESVFFLHMDDEESLPVFMFRTEEGPLKPCDSLFPQQVDCADGVEPWGCIDYQQVLTELAERQEMEIARVGEIFAEIRLQKSKEQDQLDDWYFHPWLGVYRAL